MRLLVVFIAAGHRLEARAGSRCLLVRRPRARVRPVAMGAQNHERLSSTEDESAVRAESHDQQHRWRCGVAEGLLLDLEAVVTPAAQGV